MVFENGVVFEKGKAGIIAETGIPRGRADILEGGNQYSKRNGRIIEGGRQVFEKRKIFEKRRVSQGKANIPR